MEGAAGRTLSVGPWTRTSSREADVFRILSKRTGGHLTSGAWLLEVRMRRIVHHTHYVAPVLAARSRPMRRHLRPWTGRGADDSIVWELLGPQR